MFESRRLTFKLNAFLLSSVNMIFSVKGGESFLLPPANTVCEGYVFTGVCLSTGGVCLWSQGVSATHPWQTHPQADNPLGRPPGRSPGNTPWADTSPGRHPLCRNPQADTPQAHTTQQTPTRPVHSWIWSSSGWYASHWNAFLFYDRFLFISIAL